MLKYLIALFALIYCVNVIKTLSVFMQIKKSIGECNRFIKVAETHNLAKIASAWDKFLKVMPLIKELILTSTFSEHDTLQYNLRKVEDMKYSLIQRRNTVALELKRSFNPYYALVTLFSLPSKILKLFGLDLNSFFQAIINIIGWILPKVCEFIFTQYEDEIVSSIEAFFK